MMYGGILYITQLDQKQSEMKAKKEFFNYFGVCLCSSVYQTFLFSNDWDTIAKYQWRNWKIPSPVGEAGKGKMSMAHAQDINAKNNMQNVRW